MQVPHLSTRWRAPIVMAIMMLAATLGLSAQTGTLTGRITDAESGEPLVGATVRVISQGSSQRGAITDVDGKYTVASIPAGTYRVTVTYVSYANTEQPDVVIKAGGTTTFNATLTQQALRMGEVVVSASRRPEKITEAPASVSVVDARRVQERPALTVVDHIKGLQGIDVVQTGLNQNNVVARGFNNAFSGSLAVLTDNRIASVPSLRVNVYNFLPQVNEDVQQIEVVRGPGAALYGPNTANGVLHMITRSPFASTGTWLSLAGGNRELMQGMARHSGTVGDNFGYKVSAQYMRGNDWGFVDSVELRSRQAFLADTNNRGVNPDTLRLGHRDSTIERVGAEVRLDFVPMENMNTTLSVGFNQAIRYTELTGLGAAQARDWRYMYYQARFSYNDLFLQAYLNQSDAGESYLVRTGEPVVDRSTLMVAQAQHSTMLGDMQRFTYGADLLLTNPVTDSTITGRNEDDDNTTEVGVYLQSETKLLDETLLLVVAGRFDKHSRIEDPIISPRAAIVFNPNNDHSLRFTYNRAYSAPTTNELFLDILGHRADSEIPFNVRGMGVPETGFTFDRTNGELSMHSYRYLGQNPETSIPLSGAVAAVWPAFKDSMKVKVAALNPAFVPVVSNMPTPTSIPLVLKNLNQVTRGFDVTTESSVVDRPRVRPTINQTIEFGYKGVLADRVALGVDVYRSHYKDFVGPIQVMTPNVFLDSVATFTFLKNYAKAALMQFGVPADTAEVQATGLALLAGSQLPSIPIGVITPMQTNDPTAVMLTYRNYGDITLYGLDLGATIGVGYGFTVGGTFSYVDTNFFPNLDGVADLALNAPKIKYSISTEYRNATIGLAAEARFRHVDGFPVNSGVYFGEVPGYSTLDLNASYQFPMVPGLTLGIAATNVLTFVEQPSATPGEDGEYKSQERHIEFVGTPAIGPLVIGRLTYTFK